MELSAVQLLLRLLGGIAALAAVAIAGTLAWFLLVVPPDVPVPKLTVERTPERVERGRYLATAVFGCMYCHSERDWAVFGAPPKPGTLGKGGQRIGQNAGLAGAVKAPNITPFALWNWSDGEVYRAITSGVHKDGHALVPTAHWDAFTWLEAEDVYAVIAYLRSLPPLASGPGGDSASGLVARMVARSRIRVAAPWKVDQPNPIARGEYLAVTAGCRFCHTPPAQEWPFLDQENTAQFFAGGRRIRRKDLLVFSANISPDRQTGIGKWTAKQFVKRFKDYKDTRIPVTAMGYGTEHAWTEYAQMTEEDLNAIYTYLMTQQPIVNKVKKPQ